MPNKLKLMTVIGTRPEIIRLSRVLKKVDENFDHVLVHTGQNYDYELNEIFFQDLELKKPDVFLRAVGESVAETIGNIISKMDSVLAQYQPEALLVLGDTNSCLSVIPAKRRKIPIFHMEAGNRCFDDRVPEEINRRIVDHTADINMPYSDIAREYLLAEGLSPDRVIKTGSPMFEVLQHQLPKIEKSQILSNLNLTAQNYFVVSLHREENVENEKNFTNFCAGLNQIAEVFKKRIIVSMHPRTRNRLSKIDNFVFNPKVEFLKPLGFTDYISLQINALAVLSDSGTISEEASILNFPALNIRETHERPEAMEECPVVMTGLQPGRIMQGLNIILSQKSGESRQFRLVEDYQVPNVSDKVVRIVESYTDYVNRVVWRKS